MSRSIGSCTTPIGAWDTKPARQRWTGDGASRCHVIAAAASSIAKGRRARILSISFAAPNAGRMRITPSTANATPARGSTDVARHAARPSRPEDPTRSSVPPAASKRRTENRTGPPRSKALERDDFRLHIATAESGRSLMEAAPIRRRRCRYLDGGCLREPTERLWVYQREAAQGQPLLRQGTGRRPDGSWYRFTWAGSRCGMGRAAHGGPVASVFGNVAGRDFGRAHDSKTPSILYRGFA
jgi:hypothetical protein